MVVELELKNPVMVKTLELAEALMNSREFKERDEKGITSLIEVCNMVIASETNINYGALGQRQNGCCG